MLCAASSIASPREHVHTIEVHTEFLRIEELAATDVSPASELVAGDFPEVAVRFERADHQDVVASGAEAEHLSAAELVRDVHEVLVVRATFDLRVRLRVRYKR